MVYRLALVALLAACSDPALFTGVRISSSGVDIYPAVQGRVGGATVTVSP